MSVFRSLLQYVQVFPFVVKRDIISGVYYVIIQLSLMYHLVRKSTIYEIFDKQYRKDPQRVMLICKDVKWTFEDVFKYSNQVANIFHNYGFSKGDEVVLNMEGRPESIAIALGLSKIGVITAFINNNLKGESLLQCINKINAKAVIYDQSTETVMMQICSEIKNWRDKKFFILSKDRTESKIGEINLNDILHTVPAHKLLSRHKGNFSDVMFYVYTSGTTGLTKAAIIKHSRLYLASAGFTLMGKYSKKDNIYLPLPLYHMAALMGVGISIIAGCCCTLRSKFSASKFWTEYTNNNCTSAIFIGELCRFLLAQPPSDFDNQVSMRMMISIGLKPVLWGDFVSRFNIRGIIEMYGSTEGNSMLVNFDNTPGAIGFLPRIYPKFMVNIFYPTKVVTVDVETGELIREENGYCTEATEIGMLITKIQGSQSVLSFEGYTDKEETAKKIVTDVFRKGDRYFVSGDLVRIDKYGYVYFRDRIGDTFRWKGENVSTNEVEALIAKHLDHSDVAVYGVQIPNCEGRIGMAAIVQNQLKPIDLTQLLAFMKKSLPNYALPHFIRLIQEMAYTGTMKINKVELKRESYNINQIQDPIYYLSSGQSEFKKLDPNAYDDIINNRLSF